MKKQKFKLFLSMIAITAVLMTSCSKKMAPLTESLFSADPSPLELIGTKVPVTINGRFPAKWFDKNVVVTITPVLKYGQREAVGTPHIFQGEKVAGNGITINQKEGGTMTLRSTFNYVPEMNKSELYLRFNVTKKGKTFGALPDLKIADGVQATAALANAYSTTPATAPDAFQRIIKDSYDAEIMFLVNQAELRSSELNSSNMKAWRELVEKTNADDRKNMNVEVWSYASPEGGVDFNDKLAAKREDKTTDYLSKEFKKSAVDTEISGKYTAQDWEGFQKLVQASSLQDKELVLSVLSMYKDPVEREREIRNISWVYSELAETILPQLRRSRLKANVETIGKTDTELKDATRSNLSMDDLSVEELMYAATLDGVQKDKVYSYITQKYPSDYRGWNNLGASKFANGEYEAANQMYSKAKQIAPTAAEANMNMALMDMAKGNSDSAERLLGAASGANTLNEAMGLLYIQKGEYSRAAQAFGDVLTNNAAVSQILTKNYSKAQRTLDSMPKKDATTHYLAAIVAARTNNIAGVAANLKSALSQGISKNDLANNIEFARFLSNPDIQNLLR